MGQRLTRLGLNILNFHPIRGGGAALGPPPGLPRRRRDRWLVRVLSPFLSLLAQRMRRARRERWVAGRA